MTDRSDQGFYRWWVEEHGHPPLPGQGDLFRREHDRWRRGELQEGESRDDAPSGTIGS